MKLSKIFYHLGDLIDGITMYRLLEYYLIGLLAVAMLLGAIGSLAYSPVTIAFSAAFVVAVCWLTNYIFAKVYNVPSNPESSILTGLILSLIITPQTSLEAAGFLAAAGGLAIASKYILAINHKHIFNPAAIAVVLTAFGPQESASWWVGNTALLPFVIVGGVAIVYKLRRIKMVGLFFVVALLSTAVGALSQGNVPTVLQATLLHSSLLFLGFVMLTEPLTSPTIWSRQWIYATVVGICFTPQLHVGGIYATPEIALLMGNIVSFAMTPRVKTLLQLAGRLQWGGITKDFLFIPEQAFSYSPGQYMELTLPHDHTDARGSRRYFTMASSPTEDALRFGVRFSPSGSSFKSAFDAMTSHTLISGGQVGGDFTLPNDPDRKLAFIAGGIGITPYRSMVKYLLDTDQHRSVVLLYGERSIDDITYHDVFEEARQRIGVQTTYVVSDADTVNENTRHGRITADLIQTEVPDYLDRLFYVSGPHVMVREIRAALQKIGVARQNIKVDYFSGY